MLGASSAPAQWTNCWWLVSNIFIRLCDLHQGPVREGKGADSRWSWILRDYHKIGQLIVGNSLVMQGSEIQLVEVNQDTLIQWHNGRQNRQELSVLLQGAVCLQPSMSLRGLSGRQELSLLSPGQLDRSTSTSCQRAQQVRHNRGRQPLVAPSCQRHQWRGLCLSCPQHLRSPRQHDKFFLILSQWPFLHRFRAPTLK